MSRPLRWTLALAALLPVPVMAATGIEGVWQLARPQSLLVPADGKPLPFTPEGRRLYEAHRAAAVRSEHGFDLTMTRCASPGQPRLMLTPDPFAIFVRPRMVTMLYQWNRLFRQIAVGKPFDSPALGEGWWRFGSRQGHAEASWRSGTLVVRTDSFQDEGLLDALLPGSDRLSLVERIRPVGPDRLEDRVTITDPTIFTRPWTTVLRYVRSPRQLPFPEDVCRARLAAGQSPLPGGR